MTLPVIDHFIFVGKLVVNLRRFGKGINLCKSKVSTQYGSNLIFPIFV